MQIANFILISKLTFYSQLSCERKVEKKVHLLDLLSAFLIYNRLNSFHIKCFYKRKQVLLGSIGVNCNLADEKLLKATSKGNSGSFGLCTPWVGGGLLVKKLPLFASIRSRSLQNVPLCKSCQR